MEGGGGARRHKFTDAIKTLQPRTVPNIGHRRDWTGFVIIAKSNIDF